MTELTNMTTQELFEQLERIEAELERRGLEEAGQDSLGLFQRTPGSQAAIDAWEQVKRDWAEQEFRNL